MVAGREAQFKLVERVEQRRGALEGGLVSHNVSQGIQHLEEDAVSGEAPAEDFGAAEEQQTSDIGCDAVGRRLDEAQRLGKFEIAEGPQGGVTSEAGDSLTKPFELEWVEIIESGRLDRLCREVEEPEVNTHGTLVAGIEGNGLGLAVRSDEPA